MDTLDRQAFLTVNGVQTLSRSYTCLIQDIPQLLEAGVSSFRLSPHTCDMVAVSRLYRDVADGRSEPGVAMEKVRGLVPDAKLSNGFLHGVAGVELVS